MRERGEVGLAGQLQRRVFTRMEKGGEGFVNPKIECERYLIRQGAGWGMIELRRGE